MQDTMIDVIAYWKQVNAKHSRSAIPVWTRVDAAAP